MNIRSFWKAVQQLLSAAMPNRVIGLTLQHNPILPLIARWTQPMPHGFFAAEPLQSYVARRPRQSFVRIGDLYSNRRSFMKSAFYRRYMASKMREWRRSLFLERPETRLCDRNPAYRGPGRSVAGGGEVASPSLPPISRCPSQARVARTPTISAD